MDNISGLIPIHKTRGITSKQISRVITKRFGKIKIGHVGTLDPDADGVLTILIGKATKLQDYLLNMPKAYDFELTLGTATDTLDATGKETEVKPWDHVTATQLESILPNFMGEITQIPPLYSAVKYQGKELYKYARRGQSEHEIPLAELSRQVTIYELRVNNIDFPRISFTAHCSKGTYIRTLAADIAEKLRTVGHVTKLTRVLSSGFAIDQCMTLDHLENSHIELKDLIFPIDTLDIGLPIWSPNDMVLLQRLVQGQHVVLATGSFPIEVSSGTFDILAKSSDGKCVGIVQAESTNVTSGEGVQVKLHMKRGL